MAQLRFKRLSDDAQLAKFASLFKEHGNVDLPHYYYRSCDVIACIDDREEIVGGYAIAIGDSIGWVKKVAFKTEFQGKVSTKNMLELNSVWLSPDIRSSGLASKFWCQIAKDVSSRGVPYITFGCDMEKKSLLPLYEKVARGEIYEGPLTTAGPDRTFKYWWSTPLKFKFFKLIFAKDLMARYWDGRRKVASIKSENA